MIAFARLPGSPQAHDISGQRFGELVAIKPTTVRNHCGVVWFCKCDCGNDALRTVATLRYSVRIGRKPCCAVCRDELRRGLLRVLRQHRHEDRIAWAHSRSALGELYAPTWEEVTATLIRDDIADELGFAPEPGLPNFEAASEPDHWSETQDTAPFCSTCKNFNINLFEHPNWFGCENCSKPTPEVWGCLDCTRIVCDDCVEMRRPNLLPDGLTYQDIGSYFGVSKERVRQIIARALRKLYRKSKIRLGPYMSEELSRRELRRIKGVHSGHRQLVDEIERLESVGYRTEEQADLEDHLNATLEEAP